MPLWRMRSFFRYLRDLDAVAGSAVARKLGVTWHRERRLIELRALDRAQREVSASGVNRSEHLVSSRPRIESLFDDLSSHFIPTITCADFSGSLPKAIGNNLSQLFG